MPTFGSLMKHLRLAARLSLRALANRVYVHPGHLSRIERGIRHPTPELAIALDRALHAEGRLVALAPPTDARAVDSAARESERLALLLDAPAGELVDDLGARTDRLAVDYLGQPAATMHAQATDLRRIAGRALRRTRRAAPATDLTLAVGRLSGVLAYAALDVGQPVAAMAHADLALACADQAGGSGLRAWVRGTQSLIARFAGDYPAALDYAVDGLADAVGSARVRLLCGVAQCYANMNDGPAAHRALAAAVAARDEVDGDGPGIFGFSPAKQAYYSGSSLIWLDGREDAVRARAEALAAIDAWAAGPADERSLDDEALAHVYAATAAVQLHDVEEVAVLLAPILDLPPERRISWIRKRMGRVAGLLLEPPFAGDALADELVERIRDYR